jgi:hypothetical protein
MLRALLDEFFHPSDEPEQPERTADPVPPTANGFIPETGGV